MSDSLLWKGMTLLFSSGSGCCFLIDCRFLGSFCHTQYILHSDWVHTMYILYIRSIYFVHTNLGKSTYRVHVSIKKQISVRTQFVLLDFFLVSTYWLGLLTLVRMTEYIPCKSYSIVRTKYVLSTYEYGEYIQDVRIPDEFKLPVGHLELPPPGQD